MSSESSGSDNFSSTDDIELKEYVSRSNGYSDSGSSADFTASGRRSIRENETEDDEVNDVFTISLNTSDEKHHEFDIERRSLSSLEGISPKDLNRIKKSSTDREAHALTRKASSLEGFSIRWSLDPLEGPPPRMASSLDPLNKPSTESLSSLDPSERLTPRISSSLDPLNESFTGIVSSLDPLEGPSSRMASSLDPLQKPSTGSLSSLDPLEGLLPRMASCLDPLNEPSTRSVLCLDPLEGHSSRMASSLDLLQKPSTGSLSSPDPLEGLPPRMASSLDPLNEPSTGSVLCLDPLEGPSSRMSSSLDPLKKPSTGSLSSLDSLEGLSPKSSLSLDDLRGSSTRGVSSMNPLEGPSTQTVWFPDSEKSSATKMCVSNNSELETNEPSNSEAQSEEYGFYEMILVWLINLLMPYSRRIRHSKYFLLFYVALLAIPCSAGYMSSRYWELCHWCTKLPVFVFGLGLGGMFMIILQILSILSKRYFAPHLTGREFKKLVFVVALPYYFFLFPEMATVYLCNPDFTPSKSNDPNSKFCIKIFYDYTYYLNIIVAFVNVLLMLIHVPGWYDPTEYEED